MKRGNTEMIKTMYKYRFVEDETRDLVVYEISRDTENEKPYVIIVHNFHEKNHSQMFSDLFQFNSWDEKRGKNGVSEDVEFCINMWKELGLVELLGEEFQPKHIEVDLTRRASKFRNTLENVMYEKYGCGHTLG